MTSEATVARLKDNDFTRIMKAGGVPKALLALPDEEEARQLALEDGAAAVEEEEEEQEGGATGC